LHWNRDCVNVILICASTKSSPSSFFFWCFNAGAPGDIPHTHTHVHSRRDCRVKPWELPGLISRKLCGFRLRFLQLRSQPLLAPLLAEHALQEQLAALILVFEYIPQEPPDTCIVSLLLTPCESPEMPAATVPSSA